MQRFTFLLITVLLLAASSTFAQEKKEDNTGTNPVNFTYDYRIYTEMRQLVNDGGSLIKHTMEFRWPMGADVANIKGANAGIFSDMGKNFALRFRAYYSSLSVGNPEGDPFASKNASGIGDYDARILAIAYSSGSFVLAPGLEAFFNSASNSAIGSGSTTLAPVVFGVFVGALGKGSLFAPGYQYVFDVAGEPVSRSQIDIFGVWILAGGKNWLTIDPQFVLDHKNDVEFMTIDAEWGFMIAPKIGLSGYIRPGVGIGEYRPMDYNLEVAVKYVWR